MQKTIVSSNKRMIVCSRDITAYISPTGFIIVNSHQMTDIIPEEIALREMENISFFLANDNRSMYNINVGE